MSAARKKALGAAALVAPLALFLLLFFLWPLASMFMKSVSDPAVADAFPRLHVAMADWDGGAATPEMQQALVADLRSSEQATVGNAVRRLNSQKSGFRSLFARTQKAVDRAEGEVDLLKVHKKWADPDYWSVIASAMPRYTGRFLLASVDLQKDADGLSPLPPEQAIHLPTLLRTFGVSAIVTGLCIVIGLPYAMLAASVSGGWRTFLLACVFIPMWTSILVRCTAWFIVMQNNGVLTDLMMAVGLTKEAMPLLFTRTGVIVAMTHVMLPFMVLSIFSVIIAMPDRLMLAAASLGARPLPAFLHVMLPLAMPGIGAGALLVFMSSLGFYILPALLGGAKDQFVSFLVAFYAIQQANWAMAAALGVLLLVSTLVLNIVYQRLSGSKIAGV